jgi:transposase
LLTELEEVSMGIVVALDVHRSQVTFKALDRESGELRRGRIAPATRAELRAWLGRFAGSPAEFVVEGTTGWRFVVEEIERAGHRARLADPAETAARRGRKRRAKTDNADCDLQLRLLLAGELPESWIPPAQIQQLRDRTRLRKALAEDRRRWGQRLHGYLLHEGWPCSRSNLLRPPGLRWAAALCLSADARLQVDSLLAVMAALEAQLDTVDGELRRFARHDQRCQALQSIYGIGPILARHLLAEIGEARRLRHPDQITRLAGLDPVVDELGESRRRGSPRPARRICASPRRSRGARAPENRPRPWALPGNPRAARSNGGKTDRRPQDRQASLPRPPRARVPRSLIGSISLDALPVPPEPGPRRLRFGMSRLSPPRLDNLRRKTSRAKIGMSCSRPPHASRPRVADPIILR